MASTGGKATAAASSTTSAGGYFSSIFGGSNVSAKGAVGAKAVDTNPNPEDIPKDDLLHLCMKMNKRMQALETRGGEVSKKNKELLEDKKKLLDIIKTHISVPLSLSEGDTAIDLEALKEKVMQHSVHIKDSTKSLEDRLTASEREHSKELSALELRMRKELSVQAAKLAAATRAAAGSGGSHDGDSNEEDGGIEGTDATGSGQDDYLTMEIERLTAENEAMSVLKDDLQAKLHSTDSDTKGYVGKIEILEQEVMQYEISSKEKAEKFEEFSKNSEKDKTKAEERILYLQLQLNTLKAKEDAKDKEISTLRASNEQQALAISSAQNAVKDGEINIADYKEVIKDLHSKLSDVEEELSRVKGKEHELEKNSAYTTVLKAEQESIVSNLRKDLKQANSSREEHARRCRDLEDYRGKAEGKLGQLSEMIQAVDEARDALEERDARITSLQSQATVAERNHALRTAMLATAESHITTLKSDLEGRDAALAEAVKRSTVLQDKLSAADALKDSAVSSLSAELEATKLTLEDERLGFTLQMNSLKDKQYDELEMSKKEYTKKSNAARTMMADKDTEISTLSAVVSELRDEIASGAHNERRIFELAKSQSQREATHNLHSDTRELAFQQLQHTLATRDLDLAKLQNSYSQIMQENNDLRRVTRREGVNMDYLKNVIVQYMSLPASSAERSALVPVIATLLQLSSAEMSALQTALKAPLWASLPVKTVKPMKPGMNSSHGSYSNNSGGSLASTHVSSPSSSVTSMSTNGRENPHSSISPSRPLTSQPPSLASTAVPSKAYSPPPMSAQGPAIDNNKQHQRHPMLGRSDTSDDNLDIDLGAEDTPEIHM